VKILYELVAVIEELDPHVSECHWETGKAGESEDP